MFRLILRQRRRLLFGLFFIAAGLFASLSREPSFYLAESRLVSLMVIAVLSLVLGLGYALIAAVVVLVVPILRSSVEVFALVLFADAMLAFAFPQMFGLDSTSGWAALSWFILWLVIYFTLYGQVLDRFRVWFAYRGSARFNSPKPVDALWREMAPGRAPVSAHWDALLHDAQPDPEDPTSLYVIYTLGASIYEHQTITYLAEEPGRHLKYFFQGDVNTRNSDMTEGTWQVDITPAARGGSRVRLTEDRPVVLPRVALMCWFDDNIGDIADHIRSRHHKKRDWSMAGRFRRDAIRLS